MNEENKEMKRNQIKPGFIETEGEIFEWDWKRGDGGISNPSRRRI